MSGYLHGTCSFFSVNSSLKLYSKSTQVNCLWNSSECWNLPYLQECVKFHSVHYYDLPT